MSEYKILKLKSGESIITKIRTVVKDKGSVVLDRPMSLKTITMFNDFGLGGEDKVVVRRYNDYSTDQFVEIPTSHIVSVLTPSDSTIELYDREKIFEDNPQLRFIAKKKEEQQAFLNFVEKQRKVQEIAEQMGLDVEGNLDEEDSTPAPPSDFSALMLPNDAIRQLLEMMGLDWAPPIIENEEEEDEEEEMPEQLDEEDPEEWGPGNRWQDWNIDDIFE